MRGIFKKWKLEMAFAMKGGSRVPLTFFFLKKMIVQKPFALNIPIIAYQAGKDALRTLA